MRHVISYCTDLFEMPEIKKDLLNDANQISFLSSSSVLDWSYLLLPFKYIVLYHRNYWNPLLFLCTILLLFCTYNLILNMIDKVIRKIRKNISIMNREVNVRNNKAHKEECNSILNSIICRYNEKVELRKICIILAEA